MSTRNQQNQWIASASKHCTKFYVTDSMINWDKRFIMKSCKGPRNYFTIVPVRLQRVLVKKSIGLLKGFVSSYDQ